MQLVIMRKHSAFSCRISVKVIHLFDYKRYRIIVKFAATVT
jgi:hypothetical protein